MIFFAITDDREGLNTTETHSCKRRRSQNDCFNSQPTRLSPHEMTKKARSLSATTISCPIPTDSEANFVQQLSIQLQCDLPRFAERAKQLFLENNRQLYEDMTLNSDSCPISDTFQQKQAYFVNQAVVMYLSHFVPSSSYRKLSTIPSSTFLDSISENAQVVDVDAQNVQTIVPSFFDSCCSPTASTTHSLGQMSFEEDFDVFESVVDNSRCNYSPTEDLNFNYDDGVSFFG